MMQHSRVGWIFVGAALIFACSGGANGQTSGGNGEGEVDAGAEEPTLTRRDSVCCVSDVHYSCSTAKTRDACRTGNFDAIQSCTKSSISIGCDGKDIGETCKDTKECAPVECDCEAGRTEIRGCINGTCQPAETACKYACGESPWLGTYYLVKP